MTGAPKPLRLGTRNGGAALVAEVTTDESGQEAAAIHATQLGGTALTKRGAEHLAGWLTEWARPRAKVKLWGPAEIISKYLISSRTLANWRRHPTFPKPLAELAQGPVWEAALVQAWEKHDRPRPGRPRANA